MAAIQAVAFDAYGTLFDVYSVSALAETLYPGEGGNISVLWRAKQIEYTQIRTLSGRYLPFWDVTRDALVFTLRKLGLREDGDAVAQLMDQYNRLTAFPENLTALRELASMALPLAILSNGTPAMLEAAVRSAGMEGVFQHLFSVDVVGRYKTAPEAYALAPKGLNLVPAQILFVSSNGWDACGATWFGYATFWVNRSQQPAEELGVQPTASGRTLTDVVGYLRSRTN